MLLKQLKKLQKKPVSRIIESRINEFRQFPDKKLFNELSFCLMTANFNAERAIKIQEAIGDGFKNFPEKILKKRLKELGHRFPNARAKYIADARGINFNEMRQSSDKREFLVKNVKGLGMKEASHFLRNIGYLDYSIIDFHIMDVLADNGLIEKPKCLSRKKYLEIEKMLLGISKRLKMSMGELDLYLWYLETGKVLK